MMAMAMTLRLSDSEQEALRARADAEGISMQEAARRAIREFVTRGDHRDRVGHAAALVMDKHRDALRRLGE
jgi:predicted transcriptional regulator